jgi:hypothetical protein
MGIMNLVALLVAMAFYLLLFVLLWHEEVTHVDDNTRTTI